MRFVQRKLLLAEVGNKSSPAAHRSRKWADKAIHTHTHSNTHNLTHARTAAAASAHSSPTLLFPLSCSLLCAVPNANVPRSHSYSPTVYVQNGNSDISANARRQADLYVCMYVAPLPLSHTLSLFYSLCPVTVTATLALIYIDLTLSLLRSYSHCTLTLCPVAVTVRAPHTSSSMQRANLDLSHPLFHTDSDVDVQN